MPDVTFADASLSAEEQAVVASFWWQKVYFDGVPVRRWEVVPALAVTPGMTEQAALSLLVSAQPADETVVAFGGDLDPEGQWITVSHQHVHTTKDGAIDAGGGPHIRKMLGQQTIGDRVRGAAKKVGGAFKKLKRGAERAEDRLNAAVERGSEKAYNYLKDKGKKGYEKGKELAKKYGPKVKEGAKKYGKLAARKGYEYGKAGAKVAAKGAVKGAKVAGKALGKAAVVGGKAARYGGAAAKRIAGAIGRGLSSLWNAVKSRVTGAPRTVEDKLKAVKKAIHGQKMENKLARLQGKLEALKKGGGSGGKKTPMAHMLPGKGLGGNKVRVMKPGDPAKKHFPKSLLNHYTKKLLGTKSMVVLNSPKGGHKIRSANDLREYLRAGGKLPGRLRKKGKTR